MARSFAVSIVSPVYNVAPYLRDFLRSVEKQDLGFRKNIQLVLVDDGSTDGSGAICDAFARRHPDNVVVLHQANAGQAVARKAGLALATGRIVNFCDPDDILSRNACRLALAALDARPDVDVVALPIFFFGGLEGPHPLNQKFDDGPRVADLATEYGVGAINLPAMFVRRTALSDFGADTALVTAEDAKELFRILIANPKLALVPEACYRYRKRPGSTLASGKFKTAAYLPVLEHFMEWTMSESRRRYGRLLPFVQYTLLYDLSGRFRNPPKDVLSTNELDKYHNRLLAVLDQFDDDAILRHEHLSASEKVFLLSRRRGAAPSLRIGPENNRPSFAFPDGACVSDPPAACTVFKIDPEPTGWCIHALLEMPDVGEATKAELVARCEDLETGFATTGTRPAPMLAGRTVGIIRCVSALVPYPKRKTARIDFCVRWPGFTPAPVPVDYADFAPLTHLVPGSFFRHGRRILRPTETGFRVDPATPFSRLAAEFRFDLSLLRRPIWGERIAVCFRWAYFLLRPFAPRRVWLVTDRINRADDNGLALFEYLMAHRKELRIRPKFVLNPGSPDWKTVRAIGPVIPYTPIFYRLASLLSEWTLSSQFEDFIRKPFLDRQYPYNDIFHGHQFAFLQHGVTQNDMSEHLCRFRKDFSVLTTVSPVERNGILACDRYDYTEKEVVLTGFPRFDKLEDKAERIVTFMPTWRSRLFGPVDLETGLRPLLPGFENDVWYRSLVAVLGSADFVDEAERLGYQIRFLPHPAFTSHTARFRFDPRVEILGSRTAYRDVFSTSALCVTDYSSAVFDFAYLEKPVVYCQTDAIHYGHGYFNYERDGFGPVVKDSKSLAKVLVEAMRTGCPLEEPYRSRVRAFFPFRDKNNCKRVADAVLAASRNRSDKVHSSVLFARPVS